MENTKGGSGDAGGIVTYHVINNPDPVPSQAKVKVEQAETVLDVSSELTALTSNSNQLPSSESEQLNSSRVQTLSRAGDGLVISSAIPTAPVVVTMASGRTLVTKSETVPEVALNTVVQTGNQHVVHQGRPLQNTVTPIVRKRSLETAQPGQVVTKVIITNNQRTSQPVAIPSRSISQGQIVLAGSSGAQAQHGLPRTITLTDSRSLSPHKVLSPNKRIVPAGKLPISPLKSPAKVTSLASLTKSPHKIIPSQMVTVMAKNLNTTNSSSPVTMTSSKTMITMSPTKLMVKGQPPVAIPIGSSASVLTGQRNVTSVKSGVAAAGTSEVHPQPVRGSKFQYVRLVTHPSSQATSGSVPVSRATSVTPAAVQPARHYLPVTAQTPSNQVKIAVPTQQQTISKPSAGHANQRLILPATSQVAIRPNLTPQMTYPPIQPNLTASSGSFPQLPPGTTLISSGQNLQGMQGFAIVPAQYVTQNNYTVPERPCISPTEYNYMLQQQMSQQQFQQSGPAESSYTPITTNHSSVSSRSSINGPPSENQGGLRQRKPCNCTKSQCLKLYCDCFANGEFCSNCNCGNCYNNLEHEEERQRAIKSCLERNAHAFHPKIGKGRNGGGNRRHTKGCNCKRSGCLKNYCECYEAKILCSSLCKCVGCKNYEESPDRKTLMHLADAAEVRVLQQTAAKTKLSSQMEDLPPRPLPSTTGQKMPYTFVTTEVAEATCACLIAQAEEAERTRQIEMVQERMILEEFGRCLMQVVESANKTKAPSPLPMPDVTTET